MRSRTPICDRNKRELAICNEALDTGSFGESLIKLKPSELDSLLDNFHLAITLFMDRLDCERAMNLKTVTLASELHIMNYWKLKKVINSFFLQRITGALTVRAFFAAGFRTPKNPSPNFFNGGSMPYGMILYHRQKVR